MVKHQADCIIVGGGISGIVTALELLDANAKIILFDRDRPENFGGLAKESFGGIFFVDSPNQKKAGIKDSVELAKSNWYSFADFGPNDILPKLWADSFIENCTPEVYHWLKQQGVSFFPVVHWVERGWHQPGNSVPRFHMVWGTGYGLVNELIEKLELHPNRQNLQLYFKHRITNLDISESMANGVLGIDEDSGKEFHAVGPHIVISAGGVGGNIELIKKTWGPTVGGAPEKLLNGSHRYALGDLHEAVSSIQGKVTNLEKMWHYAAGIHHPNPKMQDHGLSIVPPKSALWLDYKGRRIGPEPLIAGFDTSFLVQEICKQEEKYSWQVMNKKIAVKEFAVSGAEHNPAIRDKKLLPFLINLLFGNKKLVNHMINDCVDFVVANSIEELVEKMNALNGDNKVDVNYLRQSIAQYDANIDRGPKYFNDEQLRRLAHLRQYRGDRVRTCKFQKINDKKAFPLVAIREFILSRKSLGGIQTDLSCRVMKKDSGESNNYIRGLYAVGEAAGFGGGGIHGKRALEGTFLGTCIYTARKAVQTIKSSI